MRARTKEFAVGKWAELSRCCRRGLFVERKALDRKKRSQNQTHSTREHDRMENWGTRLLVPETKGTSLQRRGPRTYFMEVTASVFTQEPQLPTQNHVRGMLGLQSFPSGRLPAWASQLLHSRMEGGSQ